MSGNVGFGGIEGVGGGERVERVPSNIGDSLFKLSTDLSGF